MRISTFLLLVCFLLPLSLQAQDLNVSMGPSLSGSELRDKFQSPPSLLSLRYGSSFGKLIFFDTKKQRAFQGFGFSPRKGFQIGEFSNYTTLDKTHMLHSEQEISENGKIYIHGFINLSNTPFILYSVNDKDKNEERVYVNQLDANMKMLGSPMLLITFDGKKSLTSPIYLSSSPDQRSFAIAREYLSRGETERIVVKVFNQQFKTLYSDEIEVKEFQELFVLSDVALSNNRNLYLFGGLDPRADNLVHISGGRNKAVPVLWSLNTQKKNMKKIEVADPGAKRYYDYKFFLGEDNAPVVASIFKKGRETAYTFVHIDDKKQDINWQYAGSFSKEQIKSIEKYKADKEYLSCRSFTRFADGHYLATFDTQYQLATNTTAYSASGPILTVGLNPKGEKSWEKTIYKNQRLQNTVLHTKHLALNSPQGIYLIYNDTEKNLPLSPTSPSNGRIKKYKDARTVSLLIKSDGSMEKKPLLSGKEWLGYNLDLYQFMEIQEGMYQIKMAKYGTFGQYDVAYGLLQLNNASARKK